MLCVGTCWHWLLCLPNPSSHCYVGRSWLSSLADINQKFSCISGAPARPPSNVEEGFFSAPCLPANIGGGAQGLTQASICNSGVVGRGVTLNKACKHINQNFWLILSRVVGVCPNDMRTHMHAHAHMSTAAFCARGAARILDKHWAHKVICQCLRPYQSIIICIVWGMFWRTSP